MQAGHAQGASARSSYGPGRGTSCRVRRMNIYIYSGKSHSRRDRTKGVMSNSSSIIIDHNLNWGTVCDR